MASGGGAGVEPTATPGSAPSEAGGGGGGGGAGGERPWTTASAALPGEGTGTFSDFAKSLREMQAEELDFSADTTTDGAAVAAAKAAKAAAAAAAKAVATGAESESPTRLQTTPPGGSQQPHGDLALSLETSDSLVIDEADMEIGGYARARAELRRSGDATIATAVVAARAEEGDSSKQSATTAQRFLVAAKGAGEREVGDSTTVVKPLDHESAGSEGGAHLGVSRRIAGGLLESGGMAMERTEGQRYGEGGGGDDDDDDGDLGRGGGGLDGGASSSGGDLAGSDQAVAAEETPSEGDYILDGATKRGGNDESGEGAGGSRTGSWDTSYEDEGFEAEDEEGDPQQRNTAAAAVTAATVDDRTDATRKLLSQPIPRHAAAAAATLQNTRTEERSVEASESFLAGDAENARLGVAPSPPGGRPTSPRFGRDLGSVGHGGGAAAPTSPGHRSTSSLPPSPPDSPPPSPPPPAARGDAWSTAEGGRYRPYPTSAAGIGGGVGAEFAPERGGGVQREDRSSPSPSPSPPPPPSHLPEDERRNDEGGGVRYGDYDDVADRRIGRAGGNASDRRRGRQLDTGVNRGNNDGARGSCYQAEEDGEEEEESGRGAGLATSRVESTQDTAPAFLRYPTASHYTGGAAGGHRGHSYLPHSEGGSSSYNNRNSIQDRRAAAATAASFSTNRSHVGGHQGIEEPPPRRGAITESPVTTSGLWDVPTAAPSLAELEYQLRKLGPLRGGSGGGGGGGGGGRRSGNPPAQGQGGRDAKGMGGGGLDSAERRRTGGRAGGAGVLARRRLLSQDSGSARGEGRGRGFGRGGVQDEEGQGLAGG